MGVKEPVAVEPHVSTAGTPTAFATAERSRVLAFRKWLSAPPRLYAEHTATAYVTPVRRLLRAGAWAEAQAVTMLWQAPKPVVNRAAAAWRLYRFFCEELGEAPPEDFFAKHRAKPPRFVRRSDGAGLWDAVLGQPHAFGQPHAYGKSNNPPTTAT